MKAWNNAAPSSIDVRDPDVQMGLDFTDVGIAKDAEDVRHDPLQPDWEIPTPLDMVLKLTASQRERRVERLTQMAWLRYDQTVAELTAAGKFITDACALVSGGKDSFTVEHLFRHVTTKWVHANTETGLEATRQFIRDAAGQLAVPLIEERPNPGQGYADMVLGTIRTKDGTKQPYPGGFPGPSMHGLVYQRLKERGLERAKHTLGVAGSRTQRAIYIAGRRRPESKRRETVPHTEPWGSVQWCSPIAVWHKSDLMAYRLMHAGEVFINPHAQALGLSGECGCLANAAPGEREHWIKSYPDDPFIQWVLWAEKELQPRTDIPEHRKTWGWGAYRKDADYRGPADAGRLCDANCGRDPLLELQDPLWEDAA